MEVEIITIGDELLRGQVTDSNSSRMGRELEQSGFKVIRKASVGDNEKEIAQAVDYAMSRAQIVLLTGGLGPTKDDITTGTLSRYFDTQLIFSEEVYANICRLFDKSQWKINELTRKQAMIPANCTIIQNRVGTAPCTWYERDGKVLVSMPGVPYEMQWLMTNEIIPRLCQRFHPAIILHHTFWTGGIGESALAIRLDKIENSLPPFIKLAYLPQLGIVRLRLTATLSQDQAPARHTIEDAADHIRKEISEYIIGEGDQDLEAIIGHSLQAHSWTIGTAESCTGGRIASMLTTIPGSSQYYLGSIVAYNNNVKTTLLGVSQSDIEKYGAVSRQTVEQMAIGARIALKCDCAIAVSGIAGPTGGTEDKPTGTVWIAVATPRRIVSEHHLYNTTREANIQRYSNLALTLLAKELQ